MRTYSGFIDDMGSFAIIEGKSLSGILWDVNNIRSHGGLPALTLADLQRLKRKGSITIRPATKLEFVIQGNYGQGWEDENCEANQKDGKRSLKEYRDNGPGAYRLIRRRVENV